MVTRSLPPSAEMSATGRAIAPATLGMVAAAALVYLVGVPLVLANQPYWLNVLTNASVLSLISLGVWVTFSIGRINIAQGAFAMIGGYTTAILATRYGVSFWLCLPVSAIVAAAVGTLIGTAILRETNTVNREGDAFIGTFTIDFLDLEGHIVFTGAGEVTGERVTVD